MENFEIHTTPLEKISIDTNSIEIFLDDINENRYRISAGPYQAIRIVSIDFVSSEDYYNKFCFRDGRYHRHILQIEKSDFLSELIKMTSNTDIISNAKHFAFPLQEILIEIIVYELNVERIIE